MTNDDGIDAEGLEALVRAATAAGHRVTVVAPSLPQSGASHAATFNRPLAVREHGPGRFSVAGTPADCVMVALLDVLAGAPPDFVISGLNCGPNVGAGTVYSGTYAAAREAAMRGLPALAASVDDGPRASAHGGGAALAAVYAEAARMVTEVVDAVREAGVVAGEIFNFNHPGVLGCELVAAKSGARSLFRTRVTRVGGGREVCISGDREALAFGDDDLAAHTRGQATLACLGVVDDRSARCREVWERLSRGRGRR